MDLHAALENRRALVAGELRGALRAAAQVRNKGIDAPPVPMTAPPTPINHTITGQRIWNTALLELDRVKGIRKITGCTLNDVVLAICAGALRRYFDEKLSRYLSYCREYSPYWRERWPVWAEDFPLAAPWTR